MVNKKPYKPTSPPTRPRETKVKIVGPGVSSKKHVVQLVCVASWCRHDVYNYGRATASNIVMSVSVSGFVVKKGSRGWNERMPSSPKYRVSLRIRPLHDPTNFPPRHAVGAFLSHGSFSPHFVMDIKPEILDRQLFSTQPFLHLACAHPQCERQLLPSSP